MTPTGLPEIGRHFYKNVHIIWTGGSQGGHFQGKQRKIRDRCSATTFAVALVIHNRNHSSSLPRTKRSASSWFPHLACHRAFSKISCHSLFPPENKSSRHRPHVQIRQFINCKHSNFVKATICLVAHLPIYSVAS